MKKYEGRPRSGHAGLSSHPFFAAFSPAPAAPFIRAARGAADLHQFGK